MNFNGDFIKLGRGDIGPLKEKVLALTEADWASSSWRQEQYETHRSTQTIELIFDEDFRHSDPTYLPRFREFEEVLAPFMNLIRRHYNNTLVARRLAKKNGNGYFIRMLLVKLLPGGVVPPHGDQGFSLSHAHRIHVPVQSTGEVLFHVGKSGKVLKEGEVWEINNKREHSVINNSETPRIHIITDWVIPGERCCCGRKLRPQGTCSVEACYVSDNRKGECDCFPY